MAVDPNPPPGEEEDDVPPFIGGLPSTYRAEQKGATRYHYDPSSMGEDAAPVPYSTTLRVEPKYRVGDSAKPAGWGEERIVELQAQMVDAGVLKAGNYQRGVWDTASEAAYEKLLATSNAAGLDVEQTLSNYRQVIAKYGRAEDKESPPKPFISQRRDPEALKALLGRVSGQIMGAALTPEEEDRFVSTFNQMSDEAQRAAFVAGGSGKPGGPGGIDQDIDPEAQASKFLRETRPKDIVRHDVIERFDQFQALLNKFQ